MEWMRGRPRVATAAGVLGAVLVLALIWLLVRPNSKPTEPFALGPVFPSATEKAPRKPLPTLTPATPTATSAAGAAAEFQKQLNNLGTGLTGSGGSGDIDIPGIQGGSVYNNAPKHRIQLFVTSEVPIGTIGYVIPTSLKKSRGIVKNAGRSWSLSTYGYGEPKYAQIFLQAGAIGYPIRCTIKIDGRVTEQRSTDGPYGQMICVG